jgi:hypothetical protein
MVAVQKAEVKVAVISLLVRMQYLETSTGITIVLCRWMTKLMLAGRSHCIHGRSWMAVLQSKC